MKMQSVGVGAHRVMTFSEGEGDEVLLLVHGGPGCPSDYLRENHFDLAAEGLRVVTWDQLGCGQSDQPQDSSLWRLERFVEEMRTVCDALSIERCHVLGQSWGGVLGLEFALHHPERVRSFIGADTAFDLPAMQRGFERKKMALGDETCRMMAAREAEGSTAHPEYQAAVTLLMYRHVCRAEQWPEGLMRSMQTLSAPVFSEMFGPYFFNCTGNLRAHSRLDRLAQFRVPTLLLHGEHDYIVPELASVARDLIPGARLRLLRGCSHLPFFEQPQAYFGAIREFLSELRAAS